MMTADSLAGYIVEDNGEKAEKLSTEIDRLLLRVANYPALCSAYWLRRNLARALAIALVSI